METIYSHSTITFNYHGKNYTVRFQKWENIHQKWSPHGLKKMD
jgi:hypothetical protein